MEETEFSEILTRYEKGLSTPEEQRLVESWLRSLDSGQIPFKNAGHKQRIRESLKKAVYANAGIEVSAAKQVSFFQNTFIRIAASIAFLVTAGAVIYFINNKDFTGAENNSVAQNIKPGGDKAILTLADGSQVELNTIQTSIPQQGAAQITSQSGQLAYSAAEALAKEAKALYNIVTTPRGGQYQITLSDGSKAWLNAASSLKFPAAFSSNERVVELTGEAYFEIAKNEKMPFKVITPDGSEVKVLGTHFNVMAYAEEGVTKTTLLEGSVQITPTGNPERSRRIIPGQQSVINNATGTLNIEPADLTEAVAWKNGIFIFNDTDLASIMRQVSRWYDVDVTIEPGLETMKFGGEISREVNASDVLRLLKLTGHVDFVVEGKTINVKKVSKE